jgi:hypothetical protein
LEAQLGGDLMNFWGVFESFSGSLNIFIQVWSLDTTKQSYQTRENKVTRHEKANLPRHEKAMLPNTTKQSYQTRERNVTKHDKAKLPDTRKQSYQTRGSKVTKHDKAKLPDTRKKCYQTRQSKVTRHEKTKLPDTRKQSYFEQILYFQSFLRAFGYLKIRELSRLHIKIFEPL